MVPNQKHEVNRLLQAANVMDTRVSSATNERQPGLESMLGPNKLNYRLHALAPDAIESAFSIGNAAAT